MANTLAAYDPIFYAQEALIQLEKALGMAGRVHRGYEKSPQEPGSVITIRKPSTFTAQAAPGSDQDITAEDTSITLDQWFEVKFALTDQELTWTGERIVEEHIRPAAYALADKVDLDLASQYAYIPWFNDEVGAGADVKDIVDTRKVAFDNAVPLDDMERMHMMVDGAKEAEFLTLNIFHNAATAGSMAAGPLMRGTLGNRFGIEFFANQNTPSHTKGTCDTTALLLDGGGSPVAKGTTSINLDAASVTGTLVEGDTFVMAGDTQRYSVIGGPYTASGNAFTAVSIFPALVIQYADDAAATMTLNDHTSNLLFHRNAVALATAPLSEMGNEVGARMASIADPKTRLSLRSRIWYDGDTSKVKVGLDILYGFKTLDANLGVRLRGSVV
jgi:hypothetical protein